MLDPSGLKQLENSGITEAYEYMLRKLCGEGLPMSNYFDSCSYYILEYEQLMKESTIRNKPLNELIEMDRAREGKVNKPKHIEVKANSVLPKTKIKLKSKELAVTNFNIELDSKKLLQKFPSTLAFESAKPESFTMTGKQTQPSIKVTLVDDDDIPEVGEINDNDNIRNIANPIQGNKKKEEEHKINIQEVFDKKDEELKRKIISTLPERVGFVNIPNESFEIDIEMVNHVSSSGGIEKFKIDVYSVDKIIEENKDDKHVSNVEESHNI